MRTAAILFVIFSHGDSLVRPFIPSFPRVRLMGGVDVFFVLSGFLISNILIREFTRPDFGLRVARLDEQPFGKP